jgi:multimeric flavodoxin WrbA
MKVFAINSSPKMYKSNTSLILTPFLEGMEKAGATVEVDYVQQLNIKPCLGCFNCWLKTPGKCSHDDDMKSLFPKIAEADVLVLATPLYVDGMSGMMKNVLDRLIPMAEPFFEMRDGHCRHVIRYKNKIDSKIVLVSNCGFWEMDNFDPLVDHVKAICRNENREYAGALLRPHGPALRYMKEMEAPVDDIFEAAKTAGTELVTKGKMDQATLNTISRELLPLEEYFAQANQYFQSRLAATDSKS